MDPNRAFSKANAKKALVQSAFVTVGAFLCFLVAAYTRNGLLVTSIAASAFIALAFPRAESAKPRILIGGYFCGIVGGLLGSLLYGMEWQFTAPLYAQLLLGGVVAVFVCSLLMILFGVQHPPAAALAVSLVLDKDPLYAALVALACIAIICLLKVAAARVMKRRKKSAVDGRQAE